MGGEYVQLIDGNNDYAIITDTRDSDAVYKYADKNFAGIFVSKYYYRDQTPEALKDEAQRRQNFLASLLYNPEINTDVNGELSGFSTVTRTKGSSKR